MKEKSKIVKGRGRTIMEEQKLKENKGITLIALVITIIVLLILAGVSIAMLTGENGILTQAQKSQTQTEIGEEKEQIALAYNGAKAENDGGDVDAEDLNRNFGYNDTKANATDGANGSMTVTFESGNQYTIDENGNITGSTTGTTPTPPETGSTLGTVTGNETTNTTVQDSLENKVVVPAGFKVVNPEDNVESGIIIEDVSAKDDTTKGSQFVWIPTGTIQTSEGEKTINLDRYDFSSNVAGEAKGTAAIKDYSRKDCQELETSSYGNTTAFDISDFLAKADSIENGGSGGFYIGRYEARNNSDKVIVDKAHNVYNNVTQIQAADLSRNMYSSSNFTSDLVNSYAWDTALVFIQECEDEDYSQQNSLNTGSLATTGTTNDVVCNIYDMASNCFEWSTETGSSSYPCVGRGGVYTYSVILASTRSTNGTTDSDDFSSFRPLLYL